MILNAPTPAPRHQHFLGEWTRGGYGGAGGPGSPGGDHRSASWVGLRSGSAAADRKSSLGSDQRSVSALRVCPTPTPTVSRPRAFYPSRWSPNAELWVRTFQVLPHSSADGPDFAQNWMCWAPAAADHVFFGCKLCSSSQHEISNLTVYFS